MFFEPQFDMYIKRTILQLLLIFLVVLCYSQNNSIVINNNGFIVLNGGNVANPIHLVVNQPNANGIVTMGSGGNLVSENEYNYVKWNVSNSTGNYVIPYTTSAPVVTKIPLTVGITSPGSVGGHFLHATYRTNSMNIPWPSSVTHMFDANTGTLNNSLFVVDRFWIIDAMSYASRPNVNMTFGYVNNPIELGAPNTIVVGNLGAQRFNSSNNHWEGIISFGVPSGIFGIDNGPGTPTVSNVVMAGTNLFRSWTLADKSSPLPIALLSFDIECSLLGNHITWQTASETNNDYFELIRSDDGVNFTTVAQIQGNGTSSATHFYSFTDEVNSTGITVYKLIQYDYNGAALELSKKQAHPCLSSNDVSIYNGTSSEIIIDYKAHLSENLSVTLYDVTGRLIQNFGIHTVTNGDNRIVLQHEPIAYGSYFIAVKSSNKQYNKQLILH